MSVCVREMEEDEAREGNVRVMKGSEAKMKLNEGKRVCCDGKE